MENRAHSAAEGGKSHEKVAAERYVVKATSDSHFAWIRTRLAADSTLMAWIRLATTLIGFGFTIVQFFDRFGKLENVKAPIAPLLPRYLGLALIASGISALLFAIWQYIRFVAYLHSGDFESLAFRSKLPVNKPALAVALLLAMIGVMALVSVVFRLS